LGITIALAVVTVNVTQAGPKAENWTWSTFVSEMLVNPVTVPGRPPPTVVVVPSEKAPYIPA
jgi:hypothetical protein